MFRKSLIEKAGYVDEQFLSSADFEHAVRLSYHGQSVEIEENLGYYLQAGQGLSTNPNSRVHLENFVISMRYGIYNKMWYHYLAEATQYNFYKILNGERWIPVENYVPDYRNMLAQRYRQRFDMGLIRHMVFKLKKEKWSGVKGIVEGLIK
jgi:hypothetical protein